MTIRSSAPCLKYGLGIAFGLGLIGIVPLPGMAQITPDETLGNERSQVNRNVQIRGGNADRIEGGAARGSNLFHSFREFNVNEGQRVYFANPAGVANILSRVTGNDVSDIMGTLGVEGGANLFLLNPNGIIFGPNARLDISGSFFSSTANSFMFPDGTLFSATNPGDSSLLSVDVPLGVQYGSNAPGAIANAGNLSVGQNLRLSGGSVTSTGELAAPSGQLLLEGVAGDVQVRNAVAQSATFFAINNLILQDSQLQTAGDLNLLAGNTVWVRDSVANPFIAYAGGNLTVQGNQNIDIFALNHPSSGLVSGGDMVLRSANTVGGDAHYWSGGNFRIEQLDGDLGNLFSPHDPVIRSAGNVIFKSYTGASLHILAGGSVEAGDIRITGGDTNNILQEIVPLSNPIDGLRPVDQQTEVRINGRNSTLDIRAGTTAFGSPGSSPFPLNPASFPEGLPTTPSGRGANITINSIDVANTGDAQIFLTNQDPRNQSSGSITVKGNLVVAAGRIAIDSRGDITLGNGANVSNAGNNGGSFQFLSEGNINISGVASVGTNGGGAGIAILNASGNITTGAIRSDSRNGNNQGIRIVSSNGTIHTRGTVTSSADNGSAGDITLYASGDITTGSDSSSGIGNATESVNSRTGSGNGGNITITSRNGLIDTRLGEISSFSLKGQAGNVSLEAPLDIRIGNIAANSNSSNAGNPNTVRIDSSQGSVFINGASVSTSNSGSGLAGNISIGADNEIRVDPQIRVDPRSGIRSTIRRSTISSRGNRGRIFIGELNSSGVPTSPQNVSINGSTLSTTNSEIRDADDDAINAGDISINALNSIILTNGSLLQSQTQRRGNAGSITLNAGIPGNAGSITIGTPLMDTPTVENRAELSTTTFGEGNAGTIDINASNGIFLNNGGIFSRAERNSTGQAGKIRLSTGLLSLSNEAQVSAETLSSGRGGLVRLQPYRNGRSLTVNLARDSQISASTSSSGRGGNMQITAPGSITLTGRGTLTVETTGTDRPNGTEAGQAGSLTIRTGQLNVNGVQVFARATGNGAAGNLIINAREVTVDDALISASNISSRRRNTVTDSFGDVQLQGLDTLVVNSGGEIAASTQTGRAGSVEINANNSVEVSGGDSRIAARADGARGRAGSLTITTDDLAIRDGAEATVDSQSQAGALTINANSMELDEGRVTAIARGKNDSNNINLGNITINLSGTLLQLHNTSKISAGAEEEATGGNVTINAENGFVLADPYGDSDILATAFKGAGGNINITANAIFGLEEHNPPIDGLSDISAASKFSTNGNVVLNTLNIDPTRGLGELPIDIIDASDLVAEGCVGSNRRGVTTQGDFTRTGRGGLSPDPTGPLTDESLIDRSTPADTTDPSRAVPSEATQSLVEAQGLAPNASGDISLVSGSANSNVPSPVFAPSTCDAP